jgi:sugar phosphate isomerase/epimerase
VACKEEHLVWTIAGFADEISPHPDLQCKLLAELGIGYLEFRGAWDRNVLDLDDQQVELLRRTLERHGIRLSSVASPIGKDPVTDDFEEHLRRLDRALHLATVLGAPYVRIFSFLIPEGDDPAAYRDQVLRRMAALAARAEGHDVQLVHENEKHIYGDVPARCLDIVESVGSPQLRLVWDPANFVQCGVRPYTDGYALLRPHLAYLQIKDAIHATGEVVPAGMGDGELRETIRALQADGFDGFFSLEPHLAAAGTAGGFSGPELFAQAHRAFTGLLQAEGIPYR